MTQEKKYHARHLSHLSKTKNYNRFSGTIIHHLSRLLQKEHLRVHKKKYANGQCECINDCSYSTSFSSDLSSIIPATLLPTSLSKGVNAIDSTTTIISSLFNSSGRTPSLFAKENTTNPNSPPWESSSPILTLSLRVSPTLGPIAVIISVLITIRPPNSDRTLGHSRMRSYISCKRSRWINEHISNVLLTNEKTQQCPFKYYLVRIQRMEMEMKTCKLIYLSHGNTWTTLEQKIDIQPFVHLEKQKQLYLHVNGSPCSHKEQPKQQAPEWPYVSFNLCPEICFCKNGSSQKCTQLHRMMSGGKQSEIQKTKRAQSGSNWYFQIEHTVSLNPNFWVISDVPATVRRQSATNASELLDSATNCENDNSVFLVYQTKSLLNKLWACISECRR